MKTTPTFNVIYFISEGVLLIGVIFICVLAHFGKNSIGPSTAIKDSIFSQNANA